MRIFLLFTFFMFSQSLSSKAEFAMPGIFSDNMVLQRELPIKFWGSGKAGCKVVVKMGQISKSAVIDEKGNWSLILPEFKAGGPFDVVVKSEGKSIAFRDVLVGDVWLCSGQSNMEWPLKRANNAKQELETARHPQIRLFKVKRNASLSPVKSLGGRWEVCSPVSASSFSAVAYFFGKKLHSDLNIPIGLIDSSWGGSPIRAWADKNTIDNDPGFENFRTFWSRTLEVYKNACSNMQEYKTALKKWQEKKNGKRPLPPMPDYKKPSCLFNGMTLPLIPYGIKGVAWYQGEADTGRAKHCAIDQIMRNNF